MGQLLNFANEKSNNVKYMTKEKMNLIDLLPKIKMLKGEILIININYSIIKDKELLTRIVNEIVVLKCMGVSVVIVVDADEKIFEYFQRS